MAGELSDAQLVHRCRAGEAEAWDELVERFSRYVYAIAVRGSAEEESSLPWRLGAEASGLTDRDLVELGRKLEIDTMFGQRFDVDPVAAVEAAGMHELASRLEQEIRELVALAERVANDDVYRAELDADPVTALVAAGLPAATAEPLLRALALPDELLAKLPDVVAHQSEELPLRARLLILFLGRPAVAEKLRAATRGA